MAHDNPLSAEALFSHVQDAPEFHVPRAINGGHIEIPQPFAGQPPIWEPKFENSLLNELLGSFDLQITKFMVLELLVAVVVAALFIGLAARIKLGGIPRGRFWNMLEAMYLFIRDKIARPAIGEHDGDKFLPFLLTLFFFILGCNLTGMIPWLGAPTGVMATTAALALCTFVVVVGSGMMRLGAVGFLKAQVPHMDLPGPLAFILVPMIFVIEIFGLLIKHAVLAIRLLANMMAGHVVLAVLVAFIAATGGTMMYAGVMPIAVIGSVAFSLLELFVAFLQAYVFVFLAALFIGAAVHPH